MSEQDDLPSPSRTPTGNRPTASGSGLMGSGYFAPRATSPSPNPRRQSAEGSHSRYIPVTPGGRPLSLNQNFQRTPMSRRATADEFDFERESVGFSEAEEDAAIDRERTGVSHLEQEEGEESPSTPSPDEDGNLRASRVTEDDPMTLKDRQSLLNAEHPFGLPIWKPALYKKSRTVTRNAETALHSVPGASAELHLNIGNVLWTILFGWWLSLVCIILSIPLKILESLGSTQRHAGIVFGLGWYLFFPFGKYVEGDLDILGEDSNVDSDDDYQADSETEEASDTREGSSTPKPNLSRAGAIPRAGHGFSREENRSGSTVRGFKLPSQSKSWASGELPTERTTLGPGAFKSYQNYGAAPIQSFFSNNVKNASAGSLVGSWLGTIVFWLFLISIIAPLMLIVSVICWACIFTIPMARLNWELLMHLFTHPLAVRFRSAPPPTVIHQDGESGAGGTGASDSGFTIKRTRLSAGHPAPGGRPRSTVLLCTYKAVGSQYYKYTVGGVNILFVNTMPFVFFVILDGWFLLPWVEKQEEKGKYVIPLIRALGNRIVIFFFSLTSVIPLSYFIGMAVASISAQSSIGMGAVINATFGSVIEIILYAIALTDSKGTLVEGSIVGSILAGVLLMPGLSMISSATQRKESKFNAKSAGVTSTMLVMAMIGTLAPTLFYQTYGNFQLMCDGCPEPTPSSGLGALAPPGSPWMCKHCYYEHPNPATDPFYQNTVKPFMYYCAAILLLSYLVGLWFSLRTHASQIWQNPQKVLERPDVTEGRQGGGRRLSIMQRILSTVNAPHAEGGAGGGGSLPTHVSQHSNNQDHEHHLRHKASKASNASIRSRSSASGRQLTSQHSSHQYPQRNPSLTRRTSQGPGNFTQAMYTPIVESVDQAMRNTNQGSGVLQLPQQITTEEFARVVTVATVSALRQQQLQTNMSPARHPNRPNASGGGGGHHEADPSGSGGEASGHGAPSWSRTTSALVLLGCTVLYALIAEILVDVVDVVLEGSGIPEKVLGVVLFALVPNTTEFMNAMSFAMHGNISLSMEIGSAYALQVCLLQIPAMVAFSAWWDPQRMGLKYDTFTLIFPRWDVIAIILSIFLLTYTYIEAKSNYHRGSILVLSYLVLIAGFCFAPPQLGDDLELVRFSLPADTPFGQKATTLIRSLWTK